MRRVCATHPARASNSAPAGAAPPRNSRTPPAARTYRRNPGAAESRAAPGARKRGRRPRAQPRRGAASPVNGWEAERRPSRGPQARAGSGLAAPPGSCRQEGERQQEGPGLGDRERRQPGRGLGEHREVGRVVVAVQIGEEARQARARRRVRRRAAFSGEHLPRPEGPVAQGVEDRAAVAQHQRVGAVLEVEVHHQVRPGHGRHAPRGVRHHEEAVGRDRPREEDGGSHGAVGAVHALEHQPVQDAARLSVKLDEGLAIVRPQRVVEDLGDEGQAGGPTGRQQQRGRHENQRSGTHRNHSFSCVAGRAGPPESGRAWRLNQPPVQASRLAASSSARRRRLAASSPASLAAAASPASTRRRSK